jgi:hypothetical protein
MILEQAEHDRYPAGMKNTPTRRATCAVLLGCSLVALDAILFVVLYTEHLNWPVAVGLHLALCFCVALPGLHNVGRGGACAEWQGAMPQFAVWTALLGPFGALIGMTLLLPETGTGFGVPTADTATARAEGGEAPSRLEALHNALLDGRLRLGGAHAVRPLLDIMIEGTTGERLDALGLIAKHYVPAFAPALKRALQDTDTSVRVLAATVTAQLHNGHTKHIGALQDAAQTAPKPAAWRTLGEARLAYAMSGLLEPDRAKREADEAHACLARGDTSGQVEASSHPDRDERAVHVRTVVVTHAA